jgi:hypothetical protein
MENKLSLFISIFIHPVLKNNPKSTKFNLLLAHFLFFMLHLLADFAANLFFP